MYSGRRLHISHMYHTQTIQLHVLVLLSHSQLTTHIKHIQPITIHTVTSCTPRFKVQWPSNMTDHGLHRYTVHTQTLSWDAAWIFWINRLGVQHTCIQYEWRGNVQTPCGVGCPTVALTELHVHRPARTPWVPGWGPFSPISLYLRPTGQTGRRLYLFPVLTYISNPVCLILTPWVSSPSDSCQPYQCLQRFASSVCPSDPIRLSVQDVLPCFLSLGDIPTLYSCSIVRMAP